MQLINALRYSTPSNLVFVGAGGKTTAIFKTARELLGVKNNEKRVKSVLVTTTTHLGTWQSAYADHCITIESLSDFTELEKEFPIGVVLLTGGETNNLLTGLSPQLLEKARTLAEERNLPLIIEADGSHMHPMKAPAVYEPAIPDFAKVVVVVSGLTGLGMPLTEKWVHRPEKFAELSGLQINDIVTCDALENVLLHDEGGLKNIPSTARRIVLLNQADTPELRSSAKTISEKLIPNYHSVIIASLAERQIRDKLDSTFSAEQTQEIFAVIEQIGGIVLAAGGSRRFGEAKQLLLWKGVPLIRHVTIAALKAGLSPVIVVVGSSAIEVESVISDLPVRIVKNNQWTTGLSSSIKEGIIAIGKEAGGAVFLQADQPQIPSALIKCLVEAHETTLSPIVAPQIDGRRGNPVLFDVCTFSNLLSLEGDIGGRKIFEKYPIYLIPWQDKNLLIDIDSPGEYRKFLQIYPDGDI